MAHREKRDLPRVAEHIGPGLSARRPTHAGVAHLTHEASVADVTVCLKENAWEYISLIKIEVF
jgi:hypothetical protein